MSEQEPGQLPGEEPDREQPSPEQAPELHPRIWIGSLLDYNNGRLHGDWLQADQEPAELRTAVDAVLAGSPTAAQTGEAAEEWGIFDIDGFGDFRVGEHEDLAIVAQVARGIAEHGPAFAAWADIMDADPEALIGFADSYHGHYDSVEVYVQRQWLEDSEVERLLDEALPEFVRRYVRFDAEALARDMCLNGDVHVLAADGGGVWIFDSR